KKIRGLILNFNEFNDNYTDDDTYLSYYSEAVFRISDSLSFDFNITKLLYQQFLKTYQQGHFNVNLINSFQFAFRDIIEEIAQNIKNNI
ncbi:hypothetical protein MHK_001486, partial [Candidatus Magnetomorum sp. HK-1]